MSLGNLIFIPMLVLSVARPTYGLPACTGSYTGLTERYAVNTLYVDECEDGQVIEENLPVVDMTASAIVVMTDEGPVTVWLP